MTKRLLKKRLSVRVKIVVLSFLFITVGFFYPSWPPIFFDSEVKAQIKPTPARQTKTKTAQSSDGSKYAKFTHKTHTESLKIACDSCHKVPTANWNQVRSKDTAFPDVTDYPKHESCVNCHRPQFFTGKPPAICSNCHTNPSPNNSSRYPFPNPREIFDSSPKGKDAVSAFQINFSHEKHVDIVSRNEAPLMPKLNGAVWVKAGRKRANEESCKVCHQTYKPQDTSDVEYFTPPPKDLGDNFWLKKGTFKTVPIGHTVCSTCHSAETGITPAPTECGVCHKLKEPFPPVDFDLKLAQKIGVTDKMMLENWQSRLSSGTFRHEFMSHAELSCSTCHNVTAINTIEAKTKKVLVMSCSPCHITATSDDGGILNFEIDSKKKDPKFECVKCHISFGKLSIPESHFKAITEVAK